MLRMSCMAQMPMATLVAANSGYTLPRTKIKVTKIKTKGSGGEERREKQRGLTSGWIHRLDQAPAEAMDPISCEAETDLLPPVFVRIVGGLFFGEQNGFTARLVFYRGRHVLMAGLKNRPNFLKFSKN
jgi:hypothetical protein